MASRACDVCPARLAEAGRRAGMDQVPETRRTVSRSICLDSRRFAISLTLRGSMPSCRRAEYTVQRGAQRCSVTFVDYTVAQQVHADMAKTMNCFAWYTGNRVHRGDRRHRLGGPGCRRVEVRRAGRHGPRERSDPQAQRESDVPRLGDDRPDCGPADSADQPGRVEDIRRDPHASIVCISSRPLFRRVRPSQDCFSSRRIFSMPKAKP